MSRYRKTDSFLNDDQLYESHFKQRRLGGIFQYETAFFPKITDEEYEDTDSILHIWKVGDRYTKLSQIYYKDPQYWWVIALYNQRPTESHVSVGDEIYVPTPLETALEIVGE